MESPHPIRLLAAVCLPVAIDFWRVAADGNFGVYSRCNLILYCNVIALPPPPGGADTRIIRSYLLDITSITIQKYKCTSDVHAK